MALLRRYAILIAGAALMAAGPGAWAQAPQAAGRFVSVTGDVAVVGRDGSRRPAERGGDIREGDTIITGDSALAQARMSDGGLISVRADSEFKLEQFAYKGREDRNASFVVNILKGGFRTITGLIAQVNRSGYRISTPAATIGVRGTHFEVVHVLPQVASAQVPAGTYNRVFEGITTVQNPAGAVLQVVREQTAFASLQGGNPVLIAPPPVLFGRPTPVPRASFKQDEDRAQKDRADKDSRAFKAEGRALKMDRGLKSGERLPSRLADQPAVREITPTTPLESTTTIRTVPLSPIETTTIQVAPTTTTISPTTTTILQSPTTSTLDRSTTTTTLQPSTTTISPTTSTILQSPTTSTILQSPTTTTISPTTTTTIIQQPTTSPILQSPTTILQSPTTTTTTTTIKSPTTTTISPTLTR